MRILLTILSLLFWTNFVLGQCQQLTHVSCPGNTCFVINDTILDIKSSTATYNVVKGDCFVYDYAAGTDAGIITDDVYSSRLTIFPFSFFGNSYNRLHISPNGLISFDITNIIAGSFAHFAIFDDGAGGLSPYSGVPVNLPSLLYDRAVIMGLYHDLNIAAPTSVNKRVSYHTAGASPNRKFIVSYYEMPLYSPLVNGCELLFNNTHQIVIHESGLIESRIKDKDVCTIWNEGRAIVGIQNYARNQAVVAKSATVWDATNETYYFVPASGVSTFISATLLPVNIPGITTNLGDGRIAVRYELCNQSFGITEYVSRANYSGGVYLDDTITVNKVAADPLQCIALPIDTTPIPVYRPINSIKWKQISIYDTGGRMLRRYSGEWNESDLHKYPAGVYLVVTLDRNDKLYSYKKVR